jgi:iron complex outermembrane receptor protein
MARGGGLQVLHSKTLKIVLAGGVCALALATAAHAQVRTFNVPAGDLRAALDAFGAQSGVQLVYRSDDLRGLRTGGVRGSIDQADALKVLLGDSGFVAQRQGTGALAIVRVGAARPQNGGAAAASEPLTLPAQVSEVTVTGGNIRGADPGASPLELLSREDLDRSGHPTLAEALNTMPQVFGGQNTPGTVATNADTQGFNTTYGTGINLRGLGSEATLVLVNGRRLGGSGANGDFADLSTVPTIAVARVEVLLDGASAVYGSDAVAGVVNIILRRDLDGGEVRVSAGTGEKDAPRQYQLGAVLGHTWGTGGVLLAYEGNQEDPLAASARRYTASSDLRPFGGPDDRLTTAFPGNVVAVNPATGVSGPFFGIPAGQNGVGLTPGSFLPGAINKTSNLQGADVLPGQRAQTVYAEFHQQLNDAVEVSGDARWGFRAARAALPASRSTFTITTADPFFVSPNGATRNQIAYSFVGELPSPIRRTTAETLSSSLGVHVRLPHDWVAEGYLGFAQEIDKLRSNGLVNSAILAEALGNVPDNPLTAYSPARDGYFNPYTGVAANPPAVVQALMGFGSSRSRSSVETVNIQADGPLFALPGGDLKVALGATARREHFQNQGSSFTSTIAPVPTPSVAGDRDVTAAFAELRAPLVSSQNARPGFAALEFSAAVRAEHYSDFGQTLDPKFGVVWSPVADLRIRATYGASFRAPGLMEVFNPVSYTPLTLPFGGATTLTLAQSGGNPNLKPETATSWTAGFDYNPAWSTGSRLSLTWFDTDFRSRIDRPVTQNIAGALTDPRFVSFIQRISPATNPADLALITALLAKPTTIAAATLNPPTSYTAIVDLRYVNTGEIHVRGLDLDASQTFGAWGGRATLSAMATRMLSYDESLTPSATASDFVGISTFPAKLRARLSADWTRDIFGGGLAVNYTSAFHDTLGVHIGDLTTVDAQARLKPTTGLMAGTTFSLSVRNLFNTAPPFYNNVFGLAFDPSNADVIGRFVQLQLTRTW